jgi:hypothetical protein
MKREWLSLDRLIPWGMALMVIAVAVFAFTQSYTHIYLLGQTHHQTGASLRMLPLSVDWLMFAAGLVMLHLGRKGVRNPLPRASLALGAIATLVANVASGIIWGWETALIQAWAPVVLFVVVELGMILVRTARAKPETKEGMSVYLGQNNSSRIPGTKEAPAGAYEGPRVQALPMVDSPSSKADIEAVTSGPQEPLAGWGQLGGQQPPKSGLEGIGLSNGRK